MRDASLKRLLLVHELAFVLLLLVAGGLGGLWAYFWHQTTEESIRINQMYYAAQQIRGDLFRQIKEVYLARLLEEPRALRTYTGYSRRIDAHFEHIAERVGDNQEQEALAGMREAYGTIQRDMNNIFADPYVISRVAQVRILDPSEERNFVAAFEEAFKAFEVLVDARQHALETRMAQWTRWAPVLIAAPLVLAVLVVAVSRRAMQRGIVAPMGQVMDGARRMSGGDLAARIPEVGVSEAREVSHTLNEMAGRLAASQEALIDAERQAAMGSLVPVVAHNIRNPLATIRATAQLLEECDDPADLAEAREGIVSTVDRLGRWVNALVSYLHPLKPQATRRAMGDILDTVVGLLHERSSAAGIVIEREPNDTSIEVAVDADLMEQALYGLVSNAIDASPPGGTVRIGLVRAGERARITITDQGAGMPFRPEPRELEPGPSTKRFGTGLGIPVAFKVCRAHGWQLDFETAQPRGTRVVITAPLADSGS